MTDIAEPDDPKLYQGLFKRSLRQLIATIPEASDSSSAGFKLRATMPQLIGRLSNVSSKIAMVTDERAYAYYCQAWHAVLILLRSKDSLGAAQMIIEQLERSVSRTAALRGIMWGLASYLGVTLFLTALAAMFGSVDSTKLAAGTMAYTLWGVSVEFPLAYALACVFGIFGSVVSIFFRLSEFESLIGKARTFLMLTGALLPIVGSIFAIVVYAMFQSGIVDMTFGTIKIANSNDLRIAVVIGFMCGFSERFARGTLEKLAGAKDKTDGSKPG